MLRIRILHWFRKGFLRYYLLWCYSSGETYKIQKAAKFQSRDCELSFLGQSDKAL